MTDKQKDTEIDKDELSRNRKTALDAQKAGLDKKKTDEMDGENTSEEEDPARFGDWTRKGRAIDF
jgi:hypothetical protein